jgi:hypothetical protein
MLGALNKKVEEVYRNCIGDNEANIRYCTVCYCKMLNKWNFFLDDHLRHVIIRFSQIGLQYTSNAHQYWKQTGRAVWTNRNHAFR